MSFARDLRSHGDRLAVVSPAPAGSGRAATSLSYAELADRVDAVATRLGTARKLVLLAAENTVDALATYLAALAHGHPIIVAAARDDEHFRWLTAAYEPDVVASAGDDDEFSIAVRRETSAHDLHPDLALLLSTSGSTGSRKLVRLSAENVQSNAAAIAQYLDIRASDRAPAMLPMQYCYGLSVINSNLLSGAGLLLTERSVIDPEFWTFLRENAATSLHGVPYTFELLERGDDVRTLPTLRYVTQAGGKMPPERVRAFAQVGQQHGWRLFVMYGQTEATARMAYLAPELAVSRPAAVGEPIPGGSFELAEDGELLYRGPNVMLGYASAPADLASGRTTDVLHTGDLARRAPDGLWEITGRASRFVKIYGLRIDLDAIEQHLGADGIPAACTGDDEHLTVTFEACAARPCTCVARPCTCAARPCTAAGDPRAVRESVAQRVGLPTDRVRAVAVAELPRTPNGKIDYPALRAAAPVGSRKLPKRRRLVVLAGAPTRRANRTVRGIYARVLRLDPAAVRDTDTFVDLGGDSLHYVQASVRLERLLGTLPRGWPTTPVAQLQRMAARRGLFAAVETSIVLRALAILFVIGTHLGLYEALGGAHVLLVLAGWTFGRFCVPRTGHDDAPSRRILRGALRIAVPSVLWVAWRAVGESDVGLPHLLLVGGYAGRPWTIAYWFVEALVHILLALSLLYAIPAVRRFDQRHRLALPLLFLATGCALRLIGLVPAGSVPWWQTHQLVWVFALGWLAQRTRTVLERAGVLAFATAMLLWHFLDEWRIGLIVVCLAVLLFVPRLWIPRVLAGPVALIASASLAIYLSHYALIPQVPQAVGSPAATGIALAIGIALWLTAQTVLRLARRGSPARSE